MENILDLMEQDVGKLEPTTVTICCKFQGLEGMRELDVICCQFHLKMVQLEEV